MTHDKTQTIDAFLEAAAARQPTPGGGSVAALAGALAASMGEMVVNYSIGKKDLAEHQDDLKHALTELHRARQILLELMVEDQQAYDTLVATRKLPATDGDRAARLEAAALSCIGVPEAIAATAAAVLDLSDRLVDRVNKYLLSDLAVCAELSMATIRSATYNVRINLSDVADSSERLRLDSAATKRVLDSSKLIQRLMPRIWARLGEGQGSS